MQKIIWTIILAVALSSLAAANNDDCTIIYRYHEKGEKNPPACAERLTLCLVSGSSTVITAETSSTNERVIDHEAEFNKKMLEKDRAVKEQVEEEYKRGIRKHWEDEEEKEEFFIVIIKYKEDADKASVLEDVMSVGGVMLKDEDKIYLPRVIEIKISRDKKQDLIKILKGNSRVEHFYKMVPGHGDSITPNVQYYFSYGRKQKIVSPVPAMYLSGAMA